MPCTHKQIEEMLERAEWPIQPFSNAEEKTHAFRYVHALENEASDIIRQLLDELKAKEVPDYPLVAEAYTEAWRASAVRPKNYKVLAGDALQRAVKGTIDEKIEEMRKKIEGMKKTALSELDAAQETKLELPFTAKVLVLGEVLALFKEE